MSKISAVTALGFPLDAHHRQLEAASGLGDNPTAQRLLDACPDPECGQCAYVLCDSGEPLHFHHDGCPACDT